MARGNAVSLDNNPSRYSGATAKELLPGVAQTIQITKLPFGVEILFKYCLSVLDSIINLIAYNLLLIHDLLSHSRPILLRCWEALDAIASLFLTPLYFLNDPMSFK